MMHSLQYSRAATPSLGFSSEINAKMELPQPTQVTTDPNYALFILSRTDNKKVERKWCLALYASLQKWRLPFSYTRAKKGFSQRLVAFRAALKIQNSSTRVRCRTGSLCCNAAFEGQRDDQLLCFLFLHLRSSRLLEGLPLPPRCSTVSPF